MSFSLVVPAVLWKSEDSVCLLIQPVLLAGTAIT